MAERVFKGDTAIIEASLFDEGGVTALPATEVNWQVRKPDGTIVPGGPNLVTEADVTIPFTDTDLPGAYSAQVSFELTDLTVRSSVLSFQVVDPLEVTGQSTNNVDAVVDRAWMKLEDLFDSELGGPHLRDRTLAIFDREKMKRMLPDALYGINNTFQPATGFDDVSFPYTAHSPLLSQALLIESIYHLMRSYVEQPNVVVGGAAMSYFDRRDYLQRWQSLLQMEEQKLEKWLDLFKRDQMGFGSTSILVGGYAGQYGRYPRYMRSQYPYIYRW